MYRRRRRNTNRNANIVTVILFIVAVAMIVALWQRGFSARSEDTPTSAPAPTDTPIPQSPTPSAEPKQLASAQPSGTSVMPEDELYYQGRAFYLVQMGAYTDTVKARQMQDACAVMGLSDYLYDDGSRLRVFGDLSFTQADATQEKERIQSTYQTDAYVKRYDVPSIRLKITASTQQVTAIKDAFAAYISLLEQAEETKGSATDVQTLCAGFAELASAATAAADKLTRQTGNTSNPFVTGIRTGLETCGRDFDTLSQNETQDVLVFYSQMKYTVVKSNMDFYHFIQSMNDE